MMDELKEQLSESAFYGEALLARNEELQQELNELRQAQMNQAQSPVSPSTAMNYRFSEFGGARGLDSRLSTLSLADHDEADWSRKSFLNRRRSSLPTHRTREGPRMTDFMQIDLDLHKAIEENEAYFDKVTQLEKDNRDLKEELDLFREQLRQNEVKATSASRAATGLMKVKDVMSSFNQGYKVDALMTELDAEEAKAWHLKTEVIEAQEEVKEVKAKFDRMEAGYEEQKEVSEHYIQISADLEKQVQSLNRDLEAERWKLLGPSRGSFRHDPHLAGQLKNLRSHEEDEHQSSAPISSALRKLSSFDPGGDGFRWQSLQNELGSLDAGAASTVDLRDELEYALTELAEHADLAASEAARANTLERQLRKKTEVRLEDTKHHEETREEAIAECEHLESLVQEQKEQLVSAQAEAGKAIDEMEELQIDMARKEVEYLKGAQRIRDLEQNTSRHSHDIAKLRSEISQHEDTSSYETAECNALKETLHESLEHHTEASASLRLEASAAARARSSMLEHQIGNLRLQVSQHEEMRHELYQLQAQLIETSEERERLESRFQEDTVAKDEAHEEAQQILKDQHRTQLAEQIEERKRLEADHDLKLKKELDAKDEAQRTVRGNFQEELAEQVDARKRFESDLRREFRNELAAKDTAHCVLKDMFQSELAENVETQKRLKTMIRSELAEMEEAHEFFKRNISEANDREMHLADVSERWQTKSEELEIWALELKEELQRCGEIQEQRAALQKEAEELLLLRQHANKFWAEATLERKKAEQLKSEVSHEREEQQREKIAWGKQEQRNTRKRMETELMRSLAAIRSVDSNLYPSSIA
eukprot:TRINITY_DN15876_c0_g1_i1.p1 TRINITY_DN15876_c0_g1~~TRINITY_DN15876_c0_g1_i1.p1  ORF type:complete len:825 (+),score=229.66 TRINITY_DN15876_c0_g1_i1:208-2682(+)